MKLTLVAVGPFGQAVHVHLALAPFYSRTEMFFYTFSKKPVQFIARIYRDWDTDWC